MKKLLLHNLELMFRDDSTGEELDCCSLPYISNSDVVFYVSAGKGKPIWETKISFRLADPSEFEEE